MRLRTYEFYELRANIGKEDEETISLHGGLEDASRRFNCRADDGRNLYLVRVTIISARKQDREFAEEPIDA